MSGTSNRVALERGIEHHQAGRLAQAEELYRDILARDPRCADALHLCGVIAIQGGRCEAAVEMIRRAVSVSPKRAEFYANLGEAYRVLSRFDEAAESLRRALKLQPDFPVALNCLGVVLEAQGRAKEAEAYYRRALRLEPNYADAHHNLGNSLRDRGEFQEAINCFRRVLAVKPRAAETHNSIGNVLQSQRCFTEALAAYQTALALKPDYAEAHSNLGSALCDCDRLEEALASIRHAIELKPALAAAHYNLGNVLVRLERLDEAIVSFERAIALRSDYAEAYNNLGGALKNCGRLEAAVASYRKALDLRPDGDNAHSNLILVLLHRDGHRPEVIQAELNRWWKEHADPIPPCRKFANDRSVERRLRIGYFSNDLRQHSVAFFLLPLLEAHDREKFQIFCYTSSHRSDTVTTRLHACVDEWRNLSGATNEAIVRQIRDDKIDVLLDLAGHTGDNRLLVFAHKPAPVQVSYLGFPAATGLKTIDYRLTDGWADPPNPISSSERVLRLPDTAWCFTPLSGSPAVGSLPAIRRGHVTFGCFNNFAKVTEEMLQVWARILLQVPGSRLVLKNPAARNQSVISRLRDFFAQHGIHADRLELLPRTSSSLHHLQCYNDIDIGLDTFPYNGTTTTCEALWMGVPVVTLAGMTHVTRVGVSLLTNVGLPEFVTASPEQYLEAAILLARDRSRLAGLRASLRDRMLASPLMDAARFARQVEAAYHGMWRAWASENPAQP